MKYLQSLAHSGARIRLGANNTESEASNLYVNEVFPHQEFMVLVVGRAYPQGWPHRFGDVVKSHVHSLDLTSQRMVFEFPEGIKTMTTTSPRATAHTTTPGTPARFQSSITAPVRLVQPIDAHTAIARHQHVQNAISTASWHLRHGRINEATGRILSAARVLKNLCSESAGTQ
ncbi:MAG: hypothetical protein JZU64_03935 [Rhodoferax sp.]|jgi:hypothetical protein|nr:hypothetical protein [Rhodoferax sp.]